MKWLKIKAIECWNCTEKKHGELASDKNVRNRINKPFNRNREKRNISKGVKNLTKQCNCSGGSFSFGPKQEKSIKQCSKSY